MPCTDCDVHCVVARKWCRKGAGRVLRQLRAVCVVLRVGENVTGFPADVYGSGCCKPSFLASKLGATAERCFVALLGCLHVGDNSRARERTVVVTTMGLSQSSNECQRRTTSVHQEGDGSQNEPFTRKIDHDSTCLETAGQTWRPHPADCHADAAAASSVQQD